LERHRAAVIAAAAFLPLTLAYPGAAAAPPAQRFICEVGAGIHAANGTALGRILVSFGEAAKTSRSARRNWPYSTLQRMPNGSVQVVVKTVPTGFDCDLDVTPRGDGFAVAYRLNVTAIAEMKTEPSSADPNAVVNTPISRTERFDGSIDLPESGEKSLWLRSPGSAEGMPAWLRVTMIGRHPARPLASGATP
jgi:hypothetical protein